MSSDALLIFLGIDSTQAEAELDSLDARIDTTFREWDRTRSEIMRGMSYVNQAIGLVVRMAGKVIDETGRSMLQVIQSLFSTVAATTNVMLAAAGGYISTGVLAPVGLALMAFAAGFNAGQTAALIQKQAELQAEFSNIGRRIGAVERKILDKQFMGRSL